MKGSEKDLNRIILAAVLLIASAAAMITGGLISEKRSFDVPVVEIIEAEPEKAETVSESGDAEAAEDVMVNINTAGAEELMRIRGVGEKTAEKIIEYRKDHPFETIEDIINVSGIGEKKFEEMKDMICV